MGIQHQRFLWGGGGWGGLTSYGRSGANLNNWPFLDRNDIRVGAKGQNFAFVSEYLKSNVLQKLCALFDLKYTETRLNVR